jgi:hypothetical protein
MSETRPGTIKTTEVAEVPFADRVLSPSFLALRMTLRILRVSIDVR